MLICLQGHFPVKIMFLEKKNSFKKLDILFSREGNLLDSVGGGVEAAVNL